MPNLNYDKVVAFILSIAVVVLPVLITDGVIHGTVADVTGALLGAFGVGYHLPNQRQRKTAKAAPAPALDVPADAAPATPGV